MRPPWWEITHVAPHCCNSLLFLPFSLSAHHMRAPRVEEKLVSNSASAVPSNWPKTSPSLCPMVSVSLETGPLSRMRPQEAWGCCLSGCTCWHQHPLPPLPPSTRALLKSLSLPFWNVETLLLVFSLPDSSLPAATGASRPLPCDTPPPIQQG